MYHVGPGRSRQIIDYFPVGQHCPSNFLVQCWQSQIKRFYRLFSHKKMTLCFEPTLHKEFSCAMLSQMYLDNIGKMIFLCNAGNLLDNIAQGFYLCNVAQKSINTTLNRNASEASRTTCAMLSQKMILLGQYCTDKNPV